MSATPEAVPVMAGTSLAELRTARKNAVSEVWAYRPAESRKVEMAILIGFNSIQQMHEMRRLGAHYFTFWPSERLATILKEDVLPKRISQAGDYRRTP